MVKATARRRQGYTHDVEIQGGHRLVIDEPEESGGGNEGPSPTRTLAASLAACTAITIEMYADRKGWDLGEVEVEVDMEYGEASVPRSFLVTTHLPRSLSEDQVERLKAIAGKCPVHRALIHERGAVTITDQVELV
jgi:putative redox protein